MIGETTSPLLGEVRAVLPDAAVLPDGAVRHDPADTERYRYDEAAWAQAGVPALPRAVKAALDPHGRINPGRIYPWTP